MRNYCQSKMASSASTRWTWDDEKTESSCKRDMKSRGHPGMRLAQVRVFLCKHPLNKVALNIGVIFQVANCYSLEDEHRSLYRGLRHLDVILTKGLRVRFFSGRERSCPICFRG